MKINKFIQKILLLTVFFISTFNTFSQNLKAIDVYKSIHFLNQKNDSLTIETAVKLHEKGDFNIPLGRKIYHKLQGKQTSWLHFKMDAYEEDYYFTIANSYLHSAKLYITTNNTIEELHHVSYNHNFPFLNIFYRHPTWKLTPNNKSFDVYIQLKDDEPQTKLKFHLQNNNEFFKRIQNDYFNVGIFSAFIFSLFLILLYVAFLEKNYRLLWYNFYLIVLIIEFLAASGIGNQYLWYNNLFLTNNIRTLTHTLAIFFMSSFFVHFYNYNTETKIYQKTFKFVRFFSGVLIFSHIYVLIFKEIPFLHLLVSITLQVSVTLFFIIHWILVFKKIVPTYLGIGFSLPSAGMLLSYLYNRPSELSKGMESFLENITYYAILIETLLVCYFTVSEAVKGKLLAITLKKDNLQLKNTFQENIFKAQEIGRNNLVNDVHDSFGGYIEALRLNLIHSPNDTKTINELMDSFSKEYKFLLNSLQSPTITTKNFQSSIVDYCDKMNELTPIKIKYQINLDKTFSLSQDICINIYKMASELLVNAIKYSQASRINLYLHTVDNIISLTVSDNGKGFKLNTVKKSSLGLKSIKHRTKHLKGTFDLKSNKNEGTLISINIPLYNE